MAGFFMHRNKITKNKLGKLNEEVARSYLELQNYYFLDKNFKTRYGEIDIIMKDNSFYVFIEVKSLSKNNFYSIHESITCKKKKRLSKAINEWLLINNKLNCDWRVDLVGIKGDEIEHFKFLEILI